MTQNPQPSAPVAPVRLLFEDSLLLRYVRDRFNDGTYELHLNEAKTRELWDAVDAQTLQLALLKSRETALRDAEFPAPSASSAKAAACLRCEEYERGIDILLQAYNQPGLEMEHWHAAFKNIADIRARRTDSK